MSLDRRLRDGLRRSSAVVDPDVSRNLATVRRRTRRLVIRQRATKALLAMALVATVVFAGPWMLEVIRSQRDRPVATPSPAALLGTYKADLTGAGGELAGARLAGPWTLTLSTNLFQANLCQGVGVGTYTWARSGATLTLAAVRDGCTLRRSILTTAPWTAP